MLASPTSVSDLTKEAIMELLVVHYRPQTIEIAEQFKRMQKSSETVVEFMLELRLLTKSCNFGEYLKTALWDQFICGLKDSKCQQKLLSIANLIFEVAQCKAQSVELVAPEKKPMKDLGSQAVRRHPCTYHCGKEGHKASECRHKNTKCHTCHKTCHLVNVCQSKSKKRQSWQKEI